ncbi:MULTISPECIES: GAF domain-containing protein [unclassified Nodularia (in: cyanobacteria)]|uniref:GAF domain-containing hybrid sensor histidine kinase/response regulator n=1 Tax=unclassified Nodularia (in: cyanobacteria) TaxID=2656917 RepID=UPI00187E94C2|nr:MULTISPECIES: GAF domain-containing protein [unclassified Nodularia (in: cyanobacteria)]MBE9198465.1 GAF domain-containing protein [Nodularia sp. LEGE 06071]MCC2691070.1 GAF domain-containing protein [Nodularia sp. LEGE 04288]
MQVLSELFDNFLSSRNYIPHGHCYLWQKPLVALHLISDALIAIAYFSIPVMLIYFVRKRGDMPFSNVFVLFGGFIILCGTGHLLDIWTLWHPDYWVSGIVRAITAFVSCYTALQLKELLPQFLALRSPEQLEAINQELEKQIAKRKRTEETLEMIVAGTASVTGNDFFPALVQNLATALGVSYAFVFKTIDNSLQKVQSINFWHKDRLGENFEYELINTPCQNVVQKNMFCAYPNGLQDIFLNNPLLEQLGAVSYIGVPLLNIDHKVIGNLCIVDVKPLEISDRIKTLLQVFAARASAELQRKWAEEDKNRAYEELEFRVEKRTVELVQVNHTLELEIQERITTETAMRVMAEREKATSHIIQQMRQSLNLESIFQATTAELRQAVNCDRVLIYRFQPDWSGELVAESVSQPWYSVLSAQGRNPKLTEISVDQNNCVITQLTDSGILIRDTYLQDNAGGIYHQENSYCCVNDIYKAGFDTCYLELLEQLQARAYIIAPIFCGTQLWGLLAVYQNGSPRQWQNSEIQIVTQISSQLGVAVQQAELFAQTQKQAEELKLAKEAADAASLAKSEFLANMSHELRTPLNAILGFTQLMQRDHTLSSEHQRYTEIVNQSGEHLLGLINDVLEMSKIEAGRMTLSAVEFNLHNLLHSLAAMLQPKAESKGIKLIFDCDPTVPEYIKTDENKLRQILINLLGNAIKFTEKGQVTLRAKCDQLAGEVEETTNSVSPMPYQLFFEIEDSGTGIGPEEIGNLFQAFQQTRSGRLSQEGTGLGLRISQKFVQLMGGEITVESELGQGSCFRFHIQADLPEAIAIAQLSSPILDAVTIAPGQTTYRILIAEDNHPNRLLLSNILNRLGFAVQQAENGEQAIALWQEWQPHLIFMDMRMPILDGYQAARQIRNLAQALNNKNGQIYPATKIIALTASAFTEQKQESLDAGCDDFVSKPFRWEEILEVLNKHLQVEYVYEKTAVSLISPSADFVLDSAALAMMPVSWISQLHMAAAQGNDSSSLHLLTQIPSEHTALIKTLTQLIETYQFDKIIALTQ